MGALTFEKLPLVPERIACACCPPRGQRLPMDAELCVGFGQVTVSKDGACVWDGDDEMVTLDRFEAIAAQDPDHDWRVFFYRPLRMLGYQRQGIGTWVLVETGDGFA